MKRRDMIIVGAALVVAAVLLLAGRLLHRSAAEDYVDITVRGKPFERVSLKENKIVEIKQADGAVNHVEIHDGVVHMLDSNCKNQNCVRMGSMSAENPGPIGIGTIVCLPHQVVVELHLAGEAGK